MTGPVNLRKARSPYEDGGTKQARNRLGRLLLGGIHKFHGFKALSIRVWRNQILRASR